MGRSMLRPYKAKGPRKRLVREGSEEHSQEWLCHAPGSRPCTSPQASPGTNDEAAKGISLD